MQNLYNPSQKINLREERDFGEKINATFYFIKTNFKPLFRVLLLYVTPLALVAGIFSGLYQTRLLTALTGGGDYKTLGEYNFFHQITSLNYYIMYGFTMLGYIMVAVVVYAYMTAYMDQDGEVTPEAVWQHIKSNLLQAIYTGIGLGVVCFFSFFLLGLGLYLGVVFSLFFIVMIREETGVIESLERCFFLIKNNWWATFGFIIVMGFIQGIIAYLAALPLGIVYILRLLQIPGMESDLLLVSTNAISTVLTLFISSISMVAIGFQYFNLVEQKEGIGLMDQVNQIGARESYTFSNEGDF